MEMQLEDIPNEILLDVLEFLALIDRLRSFSSLNGRFDDLLYRKSNKFHFDDRSLFKAADHRLWIAVLPSIADRIVSIHLSNDDDCPEQIDPFLTSNPIRLDQFIGLQSMSVEHVRSLEVLDQILSQCSTLPFLTRLSITETDLMAEEDDAQSMFDRIWALPHLVTCSLGIDSVLHNYFPRPTIQSKSLTSLIIQQTAGDLSEIVHLCDHTPNLQSLWTVFFNISDSLPATPLLPIRRLKATFCCGINIMEKLCECLPHLTDLTIDCDEFVDGYQWERMIRRSLPNLRKLRFRMRYDPQTTDRPDEEINSVLNSFRSPFWVDEHQWFVRADYNGGSEKHAQHCIDVFTLPYAFDQFLHHSSCLRSQSTCSNQENNDRIWQAVTRLSYRSADWTDLILSSVRFPRLEELELYSPIDPQSLSVISNFQRLKSLEVTVYTDADPQHIQSQLQCILDRAPRLCLLKLASWPPLDCHRIVQTLRSSSIRKLDLRSYRSFSELSSLDERQCLELSQSELGRQCEILWIHVTDRAAGHCLANAMHNLHKLYATYDRVDHVNSRSEEVDDDDQDL